MVDRRLAGSFNDVAELYDAVRPLYPAPLFDDLAELAGLHPGSRVLEIGCGTGQATLPLAQRGYRVTCVERGDALAGIARRNLAAFLDVEVVTSPFEIWQPSEGDFDAVVAFTAFHWIDPAVRFSRTAGLLRKRGRLAVVTVEHVLPPGGDDFFLDVQADYQAVVPDDPASWGAGPTDPDSIEDLSREIAESGLFGNIATRRYVWDVAYGPEGYGRLLETYSGHRALDAPTRAALLARIRDRIRERPGGQVRKSYLAILNVAERH